MNEKGFTAIEIIVAMSITSVLAIGIGMGSVQIIKGTQRNRDWTTAMRQAQGLGYWISQDALMVNTITVGDDVDTPEEEFVSLFWKDWETGDTSRTRYIWFDSTESLRGLTRSEVVYNNVGTQVSDTSTVVADNVYSAVLAVGTDAWRLSVVTKSGQRTVSRDYDISRRLQE
jgi:prepilin-type N-terminal cleavage/methylation domain-containing protein